MIDYEVYGKIAFSQSPRILGLLDRDPNSTTKGSCFPYFWKYKFVDFKNLKVQENALFLALSYRTPHPDNFLYQQEYCLRQCKSIISYWIQSRNSNGSVSEAYPYEQSFCGTAFSTNAILMSIYLLKENIQESEMKFYLESINPSVFWLYKNQRTNVANQEVASLAAKIIFSKLNNTQNDQLTSSQIIDSLLIRDGVFNEYGGLDIGYQSISLSLLSQLKYFLKIETFNEIIQKGLQTISSYFDDFGHYDSSQTSRKTQFTYPSCFVFHHKELLEKNFKGIQYNKIITPLWLDDRYAPNLACDYLLTYIYGKNLYQ